MKSTFTTLILIAGLLFSGASVVGESTSPEGAGKPLTKELRLLKFEYDIRMAEFQKPVDELAESYEKRLNQISDELQNQGDLKGIIAVRAEIEALKKNGVSQPNPPATGEPGKLVSARAIFTQTYRNLMTVSLRKSSPLTKIYRTRLEKWIIEYTQTNRLPEAIAAKSLLDGTPVQAGVVPDAKGKRNLKVKVQIDGLSHLKMRGREIWFDHTEGGAAAPGRHSGSFPTTLDDKTEWMPVWTGKVTKPYDAGISLPTSGPPVSINLRFADGRGTAKVVEKPSEKNNYTAKIEMRDAGRNGKGFFGSDWMEFRLTW